MRHPVGDQAVRMRQVQEGALCLRPVQQADLPVHRILPPDPVAVLRVEEAEAQAHRVAADSWHEKRRTDISMLFGSDSCHRAKRD